MIQTMTNLLGQSIVILEFTKNKVALHYRPNPPLSPILAISLFPL